MIPFDAASPRAAREEFVDDVLVGALGARAGVGRRELPLRPHARGRHALLAADGRFATVVHPLLEVDGEIVSSSHIRGLVLAGEVDRGRALLGAPFQLRGEVVHGDERGRELGFPTANLIPDEALVCPGHGVYACLAETARPRAAVSIGVRPTFKTGRGELIEAYLLDFDGDLYGSELRLRVPRAPARRAALRDAAALVEQMRRDVERTREIVEPPALAPGPSRRARCRWLRSAGLLPCPP